MSDSIDASQFSVDDVSAFVPGKMFRPPLVERTGSLTGISVAIKDNIDVAGFPTGNGHPDWPGARQDALHHASAVANLLNNGACIVGKTVMDDLAFSLVGDSTHYGAPTNPRDPARYCGGSSCGAASAVASFHADVALGTDTAGSVRVPAAATGLFGFRPSHGVVPLDGVTPLSPRFDTLGLIARDGNMLNRVACAALLPMTGPRAVDGWTPQRLIWPAWAFEGLDIARRDISHRAARQLATTAGLVFMVDDHAAPDWFSVSASWFVLLQAVEVAETIGPWVMRESPVLSRDIRQRVEWAVATPPTASPEARNGPAVIERDLSARAADAFFAWPTMGGPAPYRNAADDALAAYRMQTLQYTAVSSLTGRPELTLPVANPTERPIGLSIIAPRGCDERLLRLARLPMYEANARKSL